ncbi:MAG: YkgJ family cysteine cluster protein [Hyphomicrobiales bacterium]|nr:MAG: YkgJ family cysteine cluster protein [Hyphomicrobiales bacterium]
MATGTPIVSSDVSSQDSGEAASLRQRQEERLPLALRRAEEKTRSLTKHADAPRLIQAAQCASTMTQRVLWLQRAASAWARPLEAVGACRTGCAHCCHIPVALSRKEAELLARASGRRMTEPRTPVRPALPSDPAPIKAATARLQQWPTGTPCPFLADQTCSVYAARPLVCRMLINLDDDDLLCRQSAEGPAEVLADLRDFFPPGTV